MEPAGEGRFRYGVKNGEMGFGLEEIHSLIAGSSTETQSSSFTALLELPPPQAVELLVKEELTDTPIRPPFLPLNVSLVDPASKFSVFGSADNSMQNTSIFSVVSSMNAEFVKQEPLDSNSFWNSSSTVDSNQSLSKRKHGHGEKQVKEPNKKRKKAGSNEATDDSAEKLPYVHVRARRGEATDSHSLAERARREKINARMKLLQELVPGCNKISGTALVLDEIINHVQALRRQVELLSMRLAAIDSRVDFNLDTEIGTSIDNSHFGFFAPEVWLENPRQYQYHFDEQENFITSENSLISYGSPKFQALVSQVD